MWLKFVCLGTVRCADHIEPRTIHAVFRILVGTIASILP